MLTEADEHTLLAFDMHCRQRAAVQLSTDENEKGSSRQCEA